MLVTRKPDEEIAAASDVKDLTIRNVPEEVEHGWRLTIRVCETAVILCRAGCGEGVVIVHPPCICLSWC